MQSASSLIVEAIGHAAIVYVGSGLSAKSNAPPNGATQSTPSGPRVRVGAEPTPKVRLFPGSSPEPVVEPEVFPDVAPRSDLTPTKDLLPTRPPCSPPIPLQTSVAIEPHHAAERIFPMDATSSALLQRRPNRPRRPLAAHQRPGLPHHVPRMSNSRLTAGPRNAGDVPVDMDLGPCAWRRQRDQIASSALVEGLGWGSTPSGGPARRGGN